VPPFLIIPLVYSDNALNALNAHVSNLGSLFDGLLQSTSTSVDSSQSFSESDVISLLLMLVERKTAPAHGLSLSMICTLLSGERPLEEFGLEYQVTRVCVISSYLTFQAFMILFDRSKVILLIGLHLEILRLCKDLWKGYKGRYLHRYRSIQASSNFVCNSHTHPHFFFSFFHAELVWRRSFKCFNIGISFSSHQ
jgi:hypothetical protein